ncbi:uncharacterized protein KY384_005197 [Bacidia gigantensis]|uniref:uncharacterized protein n=1 Tax=Bacidia gigantensis TaxID=2732470 RepID=UPI001D05C1D5|nr:uncharacterized protein KY384_005197 [Bacidia gigantensis]KAG8529716.1 hypothetical protein KY384_005197 [Bacidia gigantensis]
MALQTSSVAEKAVEIASAKKPIICAQYAKDGERLNESPALIFTHGAGGTIKADAVVNFAKGFATLSPILTFQGTMNLKARTTAFTAVSEDQNFFKCFGGRSMGARAAVLASIERTTHLVLVSYPLHTDKDVRDQILLDLSADKKTIFVSGDRDSMCDIDRLQEIRDKMKAKSWLCLVEGADHSMSVKPKSASASIVSKTGEIVAKWLDHLDEKTTEGRLSWNAEEGEVRWSGWSSGKSDNERTKDDRTQKEPTTRKRKQQDPPVRNAKRQSKGMGRRKKLLMRILLSFRQRKSMGGLTEVIEKRKRQRLSSYQISCALQCLLLMPVLYEVAGTLYVLTLDKKQGAVDRGIVFACTTVSSIHADFQSVETWLTKVM